MLYPVSIISLPTGIAAISLRNFFLIAWKTLSFPVSLPLYFSWKVLSIHRRVLPLAHFKFNVSSFISIFFLCENFSFFTAHITASLRFPANFFLTSEETRPVNYNSVYLHLCIHIVIYYRNKDTSNLYYLHHLLQFVFIISSYSPLLLHPHFSIFLNWEMLSPEKRDFFTHFSVKESRSNREFLSQLAWKVLSIRRKVSRKWRE